MSENDILQVLGKRIQLKRNELGISQEELADRASVHRTYIGMIERGEKNITIKSLKKISSALGITLVDILEGVEDVR